MHSRQSILGWAYNRFRKKRKFSFQIFCIFKFQLGFFLYLFVCMEQLANSIRMINWEKDFPTPLLLCVLHSIWMPNWSMNIDIFDWNSKKNQIVFPLNSFRLVFWRFLFSSKFHFKTPHDLDSQSDYSYVVDCGKPLIFIKKIMTMMMMINATD